MSFERRVLSAEVPERSVRNWIQADIIAMIASNPGDGEYALDLLMIAKYFERIGDHCTNIAEWVEFSLTGIREECQ